MATAKRKTAKRMTAKKLCSKVVKSEGINSRTGQLKRGYKYKKGGGVVKAKTKK